MFRVKWLQPNHRVTLEKVTRAAMKVGFTQDQWVHALSAMIVASRGYKTVFFDDLKEGESLKKELTILPLEVYEADDTLGWAYQACNEAKKKENSKAEIKIGGKDLHYATQMMTEPYMVDWMLQNTLGQWWLLHPRPDNDLLSGWDYCLVDKNKKPLTDTGKGWPKTAKELKVMDPCSGSGHSLMEAFCMLTNMRMTEEGLSVTEAGDAILRDNLFGLDIDLNITNLCRKQLALLAWKIGGYRVLPEMNIDCSGLEIPGVFTKGEAENIGSLLNPQKRMRGYLREVWRTPDVLMIPPVPKQLSLLDEAA